MILEGAGEAEALDFSPAQPRSTERVAGSGKLEVYSPKYTEDFRGPEQSRCLPIVCLSRTGNVGQVSKAAI